MATAADVSGLDPSNILDVDLFSDETRQNWMELAADWATRPPFFVVNFGMPMAVISRNKDVREVLLAPERFTSTPPEHASAHFDAFMGLTHLGVMDGPAHDRIRRILQPWFGAAGVRNFESEINRVVNEILDEMAAKAKDGPVDLVWDFSRQLIPRIMLGEMFNLNEERRQLFIRMNRLLESVAKVGGYPEEYVECFHECRRVIDEIIAEREAQPNPTDFIGGLVAGRESGDEPITNDEIAAQVFAICAAAMTTTTTETTMTLYAWMRHRDEFEMLREKPELVPQAIEESLRLHPAGLFIFPRFATVDTEVGGTQIPAGMVVHVCVAAADLDPEAYPDPLEFKIDRNPKHVMVFGAGPHFCAGAIFARRIVAASLKAFMERYPGLETADPKWKPRYDGQLGETAPQELLVTLN